MIEGFQMILESSADSVATRSLRNDRTATVTPLCFCSSH